MKLNLKGWRCNINALLIWVFQNENPKHSSHFSCMWFLCLQTVSYNADIQHVWRDSVGGVAIASGTPETVASSQQSFICWWSTCGRAGRKLKFSKWRMVKERLPKLWCEVQAENRGIFYPLRIKPRCTDWVANKENETEKKSWPVD